MPNNNYPKTRLILHTKRQILNKTKAPSQTKYSKEIIEFSKTFQINDWNKLCAHIKFLNAVELNNLQLAQELSKKILLE